MGPGTDQTAGANTKFIHVVKVIHRISKATVRKKKLELLNRLMDNYGRAPNIVHGLVRLLVPELDRERRPFRIKESTLVKFYKDELKLGESSPDFLMLSNWRDKTYIHAPGVVAGDYMSVMTHVLQNRCVLQEPRATVADINRYLQDVYEARDGSQADRFKALHQLFLNTTDEEQLVIIRIILSERMKSEMGLGMGWETILKSYHPRAVELYNVCHNLRRVCEDPLGIKNITFSLCLKPMLASRKDPIEIPSLMASPTHISQQNTPATLHGPASLTRARPASAPDGEVQFCIEPKMDGERLQVHYNPQDGDFRLFTRQATEYTDLYGPKLGPLFKTHINCESEVILDGEVMTFDNETGQYMDFGHAKTVANAADGGTRTLCYLCFDILMLNGQSTMGRPLRERKQLLRDVIRSEKNVFEVVDWRYGSTTAHIIAALEEYCAARFEGAMVKRLDSLYIPGERKSSWVKVKPEYVDGMYDQIDTVILGGYFGYGHRAADGRPSHFLVGVVDDKGPVDADGRPRRFHVLTKVGTGYSKPQLNDIRDRLHDNWEKRARDDDPSYTPGFRKKGVKAQQYHNIEWPDLWVIDPSKSVVLEVKAASITVNDRMVFGYNLRFPRVLRVRSPADKGPADATSGTELLAMHTEAKNYNRTASIQSPQKKKQKTAPRKHLSVMGAGLHRIVQDARGAPREGQGPQLFQGHRVCVMIHEIKHREVFDSVVRELVIQGAEIQPEADKKTSYVVAVDKWTKVANHVRQMQAGLASDVDVVKPEWVSDSVRLGLVVQKMPKYLVHTSASTREKMKTLMDEYGDSYTDELTLEELDTRLHAVATRPDGKARAAGDGGPPPPYTWPSYQHPFQNFSAEEVDALKSALDVFWQTVVYDPPGSLADPDVLTLARVFMRRHGARVSDKLRHCTHVLVDNEGELVSNSARERASRHGKKLVTMDWVKQCVEKKCLLAPDGAPWVV